MPIAMESQHPAIRERKLPDDPRPALCALLAERARVCGAWADVIAAGDHALTPADIHDIRVAGRRMASVLRYGLPLLGSRARKLRHRIVAATRAFGAARDCDVFLGILRKPARSHPESIGALSATLTAHRDEQNAAALAAFREALTPGVRRALAELAEGSAMPRILGCPADGAARILAGPVREVIETFFEMAAGCGRQASAEQLHDLRRAGKRLRYTVEACGRPDRPTAGVLVTLRSIQDALGTLHDLDVVAMRLWELAEEERAAQPGFGPPLPMPARQRAREFETVRAALVRRRDKLRQVYHRRWPPGRLGAFRSRILRALRIPDEAPVAS